MIAQAGREVRKAALDFLHHLAADVGRDALEEPQVDHIRNGEVDGHVHSSIRQVVNGW